jgi:hypothetical protein
MKKSYEKDYSEEEEEVCADPENRFACLWYM